MAKTRGKTMLGAELPDDLVGQFRAYVAARGERIGAALERAIRREMAYPPPPPAPPPLAPLPDAAPPARPKGKGGR